MTGFFSKLFGGKNKASGTTASTTTGIVEEIMNGLIEKAQLDLSFSIQAATLSDGTEEISVEINGNDQVLLTEKEGALLDSFQLFIKRVVQHRLPDARVNVNFDCNGFRDESSRELVDLAEKLRDKALEQGRSVYLRALAPKDRKIVHQHLASDDRIRSRSVGDGLYKKIKIYPVKSTDRESSNEPAAETNL